MENRIEVKKIHTVVVGSGAAGLNGAHRLRQYGVKNVALVTEDMKAGTSRNTGSDKQTYYKLSLAGEQGDRSKHSVERYVMRVSDNTYNENVIKATLCCVFICLCK